MKFKIIKKVIFSLILATALAIFSPLSFANAQELLVEDSVRFYDVHSIDAGEKLTLCASDYVYEINLSLEKSSIVTHEVKGAKKAYSSAGALVYLADDILYCNGDVVANFVVDFYAIDGNIYYCSANGIFNYTQENSEVTQLSTATAFTVTQNDNVVYYATKENGYCDVYSLSNGTTSLLHKRTRAFNKLIFDDVLYGASQNVLYNFDTMQVIDPESESFTIKNSVAYILKSNNIYTQDGFAIGSGNEILYPSDVSSYNDLLAVTSDFGLQLYSLTNGKYEKTRTIDVDCSLCAICPNSSVIYFSYENILYKYSNEISLVGEYAQYITDIAVDNFGNVYVSADSIYKNGELLYESLGGGIGINLASNDLACYYNGSFYLNGEFLFEKSNVSSFTLSDDNKIFALFSNGTVEKIDTDGNVIDTYNFDIEQGVSITMLHSLSNAGKIAIVDKTAHNVIFSIEPVAMVYDKIEPTVQEYDQDIIRKFTANTPVYSDMLRSSILTTLNENTTVFCLVYDIETNANFSLVAFSSQEGLKTGYVLKNTLTDTYEGELPLYESATTFFDSVHILTLPYNLEQAPNSRILTIENKGTSVELISKIYAFGQNWYKVRYENVVGFISAPSLQLDQFVPSIRPNVNATVTSTCATYEKQGDEFVETDVYISQNSRVEIVGIFDSNTEYTLVNYYNESAGGVRTCYVLTSNLKYDYTTPEQQIALVLILVLSITTIIAVAIGLKFYKTKRNN